MYVILLHAPKFSNRRWRQYNLKLLELQLAFSGKIHFRTAQITFLLTMNGTMNAVLSTSKTATNLVDLTLGNFSYLEEFPTLSEVVQSARKLPHICTPPQFMSPPTTPPRSCSSDVTVHTPAGSFCGDIDDAFDCGGVVADSNTDPIQKRKSPTQLVECREDKKPRLVWKLEKIFPMSKEAEALAFVQSQLVTPGFKLSKNQPYCTKTGVVQCYRCSGQKRNMCAFKAKVVYDNTCDHIEIFSNGVHEHGRSLKGMTGISAHYKPIIQEAVKDGLPPAKIHRKLLSQSPKSKVTLSQVQAVAKREAKKLLTALEGNTIGDLYTYLSENTLSDTSAKHDLVFFLVGVLGVVMT